jgi:thiol:disulfide interchange protein DsbD
MIREMTMILGLTSACATAAGNPGKAAVAWISSSAACAPGGTVQTAIRMEIDEGWHTYWLNPGEAGMKTRVEWRLPEGWSASGLAHPVPRRFSTSGLAGFGYEGTVWFPVTLTAPADFEGTATLKGKISWLACNDGGCIPGEAELSLDVRAGSAPPGADAPAVLDALRKIPQPQDAWLRLGVAEKPGLLVLTIAARSERRFDPERYEVFPATPQVIDPAAPFRFTPKGAEWTAELPKSEYAGSPVKRLTLVFGGKGAEEPIELTWEVP